LKTSPIVPAEVDFSDPAAPASPAFGDVYHSRAGAWGQAHHVFLAGNGLPERWRDREHFTVLETGFGLGNNFLATWDAWCHDPQRPQRLYFVSVEKHPLRRADLARAHAASPDLAQALVAQWPPLTPGLHRLVFEQGRVVLLLGLGDARDLLRELVVEADAFFLDGFAPARNPQMWDRHLLKFLARLAAPKATAATWSVARELRDGLAAAGFTVERAPGFGGKDQMSRARYAPRHAPQVPAARRPLAPAAREAVVLGAGLAGAACAHALAEAGVACSVVDACDAPATRSSGNPAGLFHGTLNPDDGPHARFNRAAALATAALLERLELPWRQRGLLRLELRRSHAEMQADLGGLPADYARALEPATASALAGASLDWPAWHYPGGGALCPGDLTRALLAASGARLRLGTRVAGLRRSGNSWQLLGPEGQVLLEASLLILAGGHTQLDLLRTLDPALASRLVVQRGQITHLPQSTWRPALPVAGEGYAIDDRNHGVWCGATTQDGDPDPELRDADHADNLARFARLSGVTARPEGRAGRVGWRLIAPDRLPLIGGLADGRPERDDQLRLFPRQPGLLLCTALASRGISWAALAGQLTASLALGTPRPLEADLIDAVDPLRFELRQRRLGVA
jgi:tRNA 5-methylaminomethyl-2-thiouridine biosynthesis bifunctional protein